MFVFVIINYVHKFASHNMILKVFYRLGIVSSNIWFLHCLFFSSVTREVIQPYAYWSANPVIVLLVLMVELYLPAAVFTKFDNAIIRMVFLRKEKDTANRF